MSAEDPRALVLHTIHINTNDSQVPLDWDQYFQSRPPDVLNPKAMSACRTALEAADIYFPQRTVSTVNALVSLVEAAQDQRHLDVLASFGGGIFPARQDILAHPDRLADRAQIENRINNISGNGVSDVSKVAIALVPGYGNIAFVGFSQVPSVLEGMPPIEPAQPTILLPASERFETFCRLFIQEELAMYEKMQHTFSPQYAREAGCHLGEIQRLLNRKDELYIDRWAITYLMTLMVDLFRRKNDHTFRTVNYSEDGGKKEVNDAFNRGYHDVVKQWRPFENRLNPI